MEEMSADRDLTDLIWPSEVIKANRTLLLVVLIILDIAKLVNIQELLYKLQLFLL